LRLTLAGGYDAPQHRSRSEPTVVVFGNRPGSSECVGASSDCLGQTISSQSPMISLMTASCVVSKDDRWRRHRLRLPNRGGANLAVNCHAVRPEDKVCKATIQRSHRGLGLALKHWIGIYYKGFVSNIMTIVLFFVSFVQDTQCDYIAETK